ncbi:hypothetical protein DSL92_03645 [Billgrantia gudaonensis]|uniref:Uncharacterized protein n=1 Tax=Billgrantia gudaonensis TaxID=376427 RepID=A0A3S0R586_9GAMM|nr:hypothetical protein DSL92_03645 [Halomonas gudaonensis]
MTSGLIPEPGCGVTPVAPGPACLFGSLSEGRRGHGCRRGCMPAGEVLFRRGQRNTFGTQRVVIITGLRYLPRPRPSMR